MFSTPWNTSHGILNQDISELSPICIVHFLLQNISSVINSTVSYSRGGTLQTDLKPFLVNSILPLTLSFIPLKVPLIQNALILKIAEIMPGIKIFTFRALE